ncbi:hypothetical protein ACFPM3_27155 [Streptomyces coeruleoprunus]|uniref:Uncharacterized protein n=1 Tax=Streptomyces coeruleoprunus TaxID=285563 RepID=A0ABV9XL82_9ACTN
MRSVLAGCLAVGLWGTYATEGRHAGSALDAEYFGGSGTLGYHQAEIGRSYWYAIPLSSNRSDEEVHITKAEILDVPAGIEVVEYRAFEIEENGAKPMFFMDGESGIRAVAGGVTVPAGDWSRRFYAARLQVTGKIRDDVVRCRYEYEKGGRTYTQLLGCNLDLKVRGTVPARKG